RLSRQRGRHLRLEAGPAPRPRGGRPRAVPGRVARRPREGGGERAVTLVHSRASRHQHIVDLLARTTVRSQAELVELLAGDGFAVTQATLSRDLDELGATKVRDDEGRLVYAVPGEGGDLTPRAVPDQVADLDRLRRRCADLVVSVDSSANIVILRTPPGGA